MDTSDVFKNKLSFLEQFEVHKKFEWTLNIVSFFLFNIVSVPCPSPSPQFILLLTSCGLFITVIEPISIYSYYKVHHFFLRFFIF